MKKPLTLLGVLANPWNAHHMMHSLMSHSFLNFLAPIVGAIGKGLTMAPTLLSKGVGLLGSGLTKGLGFLGGTGGQGGLLGNLFGAGKQLYGGLDKLTGGMLPGGISPFGKGGLLNAFGMKPEGGLFGNFGNLYKGVDRMLGGMLPGGVSPYSQGGLLSRFGGDRALTPEEFDSFEGQGKFGEEGKPEGGILAGGKDYFNRANNFYKNVAKPILDTRNEIRDYLQHDPAGYALDVTGPIVNPMPLFQPPEDDDREERFGNFKAVAPPPMQQNPYA